MLLRSDVHRSHHRQVLPKHIFVGVRQAQASKQVASDIVESAALAIPDVYARWETRRDGLNSDEAVARLVRFGPNVLARDQRMGLGRMFLHSAADPLVLLLSVLALVSFGTGDLRAGVVMSVMISLGVGLKLIQEGKASKAAERLRAMISVTATVIRNGQPMEVPMADLTPGEVVALAAGDMIPADIRIIEAKDLFVSQGSLTGESLPVEKFAVEKSATTAAIEMANVAFLGTSVESGSATAVVIATGGKTYLGGMAATLSQPTAPTAFDRGVTRFTGLMFRFVLVMAPLVFLINGLTKGHWTQAFFFAVAVAVGLTPEMLPMIVTVCLSKGALAMSDRKVIVKRLNAIQNLGAMDVLCTDKTGTLTMDHVVLEKHCDVVLKEDTGVLALAYLNSHFQTGLKNLLDRAILAHAETHAHADVSAHTKVDEIPFDFQRRIMSVVVRTPEGKDRIISKGAPEEIFPRCTGFELDGEVFPMDHMIIEDLKEEYEQLSGDGFRVLAMATRDLPPSDAVSSATPYSKADECDLILKGYVAFLDPPKDTAKAAIKALEGHGIAVKVITGDNELVARKVCRDVGLSTEFVLAGAAIQKLNDEQLADAAEKTSLFARISPADKRRIITALRSRGHTVGFMGDGINDAPALRTADVGISVDTAVDIAKESADMILLEKSLMVLEAGVIEGRKVFANILKYVRMGASSNFGNMFSVLGASVFVPFLPMAPIQILANNLLYDISQTAIPTDRVDPEQVEKPRPWDIAQLTRYILFVGPCSSIFDYTTFGIMLFLFHCSDVSTPEIAAHSQSLFQTGWFVESLVTQTLIIHVIRTNRIPFLQSHPSEPLLLMSAFMIVAGMTIPFTPLGSYLGFTALPPLYWPLLALTSVLYVVLTQFVKMWLLRRKWI